MPRTFISLNQPLYDYVLANHPPEHAALAALRAETRELPNARMQIATEQGHFLAFLVRLIGARDVLEIGTFTGYSALAMALALPSDGHLVTCDVSEEWTNIGRRFWNAAGVGGKIAVWTGPALATLERLSFEGAHFDLIFIDANKDEYDAYYERAIDLVRSRGLIVLDNMLQRGRVADPKNNETRAACVRELNTKIARDERVDHVLLPIGDGMTLARRQNRSV